jgi:hypothetical protein
VRLDNCSLANGGGDNPVTTKVRPKKKTPTLSSARPLDVNAHVYLNSSSTLQPDRLRAERGDEGLVLDDILLAQP